MIVSNDISVVIADDHTLLREALRDIMRAEAGVRVVGEAQDGESMVAAAARVLPDVVLLDVEMPGYDAVMMVQRLRQVSPRSRIIVLSMHDDQEIVSAMLRSGVCAYLHKGVSMRDLLAAIRSVGADDQTVTISISRESIAAVGGPAPFPAPVPASLLSEREREVLDFVAQAMSNRQIARQLGITEGTVKRHLRNIFEKLNAVSRIDAVNKATVTRAR
ncbi:MAG: response regulator transcription factor [Nocardiopsaceae bacterium]|nr:response regulator transcription factor [Nocardiopsaceae bacterium]